MTDFSLFNHGSIFLLSPNTEAALAWVEEHIAESHMTWGDSVVIEPRYIGPIVDGAIADGLTVGA